MIAAVRALFAGVSMVARAPLLLVSLSVVTFIAALPFGLVLGERLRTALAHQPAIDLKAEEIDPEWWMEFRAHARGLEATFTPTVLGFAAPLDNLSALLDASPRPLVLAGPVLLYGVLWAFLLGGVLERFNQGGGIGLRGFCAAGLRRWPRFLLIGIAAGSMSWLLFLTVHAWLFGPVYEWLAANASSERNAFFWRVALYLAFGALLMIVTLVADYTRVSVVSAGAATLGDAVESSVRFIRRHLTAVVALYLLTGVLFTSLLVAYGLVDRRFGGWRAVVVGQAYIVARLAIRLTFAASELRLFKRAA